MLQKDGGEIIFNFMMTKSSVFCDNIYLYVSCMLPTKEFYENELSVIMDPINAIKIKKDSTFAMLLKRKLAGGLFIIWN